MQSTDEKLLQRDAGSVCVCMHVCICTHTHTHTHTLLQRDAGSVCVCMHMCAYVHTHTHTHTHCYSVTQAACVCVCICAYVHTHTATASRRQLARRSDHSSQSVFLIQIVYYTFCDFTTHFFSTDEHCYSVAQAACAPLRPLVPYFFFQGGGNPMRHAGRDPVCQTET